MSRKLVLVVITSILLVSLHGSTAFARIISNDEFLDSYDVEVSNSTVYVSVPFYYQSNNYYCGPAALEMVLDYYGEDIPQTEIADVARTYPYVTYTDELRRAAHFSNFSTSLGDEMSGNITGYSAREVGFAAFEQWGLTIDDLKTLVNKGEPLIVLMWWTPSKVYGHYRVVVGYNETHIIMHDPWNKDLWEGTYGGANTTMTYSTFLDLWEYLGNWTLWVHPWDVEMQTPSTVTKGDNLEVTANITYPCSTPFDASQYSAFSCNATVELQQGLELGSGETTQHSLGNITAGNSVQTSWSIHASETGFYNISVKAMGIIEGSVWAHGTYPSYDYEDVIGGLCVDSLSIINQTGKVHNLDTSLNYTSIQEAINAPETLYGHVIFVEEGTYYEHVTINKSISLIGENRSNTIIDGKHKGDVVHISADNVVVSRFTIINSKDQGGYAGINSRNIKNCSIRESNILSNWRGIWIYNCTNNIIHGNSILNTTESLAIWVHYANNTVISSNIVTNNPSGVYLYYSDDNIVRRNTITDNNYYGLTLTESTGNLIIENVIANNSEWDGVALWDSCDNTVTANNILNNPHGLRFGFSSNNTIYHNNFINNAIQAYDTYREYDSEPSINSWDDGYPSGGNYWNDYNGTDTDHDGIGNTLYVINLCNNDSYPLMGPFHSFNTTLGKHVNVISNSTIKDFKYFESNSTIKMYVSNMTSNQTSGFCRVTIPHTLMNVSNIEVIIDNDTTPLLYHNYALYDNGTHRWIYFSYPHSIREIDIIPEFPSFLILPLFMIVTLLAVIIYRTKASSTSHKN